MTGRIGIGYGYRAMTPEPERDWMAEGIDLFNAGRFFECHEAWEQLWKRSSGAGKIFLQGLIQAAAAMLHVERGNRDGAESLYAKARAKLDRYPEVYCGLEVGELRRALDAYFDAALGGDMRQIPAAPKLIRTHRRT